MKRNKSIYFPPLKKEITSSWIARLSIDYGVSVKEFFTTIVHNPKYYYDIDKNVTTQLIFNLSNLFGIEKSLLMSSSVLNLLESVDCNNHDFTWITYVGGHYNATGIMFCPLCLHEDRIPHYRVLWRVSFVTTCPKHGLLLLDHCSNCKNTINILELPSGICKITTCNHCNTDLSKMMPLSDNLCPTSIYLQNDLLHKLHVNINKCSSTYNFKKYYFNVLHNICLTAASVFDVVSIVNKKFGSNSHKCKRNFISINKYCVLCRHIMLLLSYNLISEWPSNMKILCDIQIKKSQNPCYKCKFGSFTNTWKRIFCQTKKLEWDDIINL